MDIDIALQNLMAILYCLDNDILIVENLTNLEKLDTAGSTVMFLPLKIKDGDGSPVRAVAFV